MLRLWLKFSTALKAKKMKIPKRIGFLGLGIMGRHMAFNLLNKGFKISVYNRTRSKTEEFSKAGCSVAATPKELSRISNTLITMVQDDEALLSVLEGPEGILAGASPGTFLINMSTISRGCCLKIMEKCFEKGLKFIDCPVAGSKPLAEKGTLVLLCGAEKNDIEENRDILLSMGKAIVNPGPPPAGTGLKLCINLLLAQMTSGLCESAALAEKLSIDPSFIFETIKNSPALDCGYFRMKENNIIKGDFSPAFSVKNILKDLRYINRAAAEKGLELPVTGQEEKIFEKTYRAGFYNEDLCALLKILKS